MGSCGAPPLYSTVRSEFPWILATYHQFGGMKISSQLANNFDYCSAEKFEFEAIFRMT
jgi:hypothetical protein